jgi:hypothetical protein
MLQMKKANAMAFQEQSIRRIKMVFAREREHTVA